MCTNRRQKKFAKLIYIYGVCEIFRIYYHFHVNFFLPPMICKINVICGSSPLKIYMYLEVPINPLELAFTIFYCFFYYFFKKLKFMCLYFQKALVGMIQKEDYRDSPFMLWTDFIQYVQPKDLYPMFRCKNSWNWFTNVTANSIVNQFHEFFWRRNKMKSHLLR